MLWSFLQKFIRQNHQVFYFFCSFYISRYIIVHKLLGLYSKNFNFDYKKKKTNIASYIPHMVKYCLNL